MDLDDVYHLMIALTVLFLGMAAVGLVGELLGWWNDTGQMLITIGTLGAIPVAVVGLLLGAGRGQVSRMADVVLENNGLLNRNTELLLSADRKLDKLEKLDELDVIQVQLDQQTGVLERQLAVLTELRDRA